MKDTDIYQNNPNVRWATKSLYASRHITGEKISIDNVVANDQILEYAYQNKSQ